MIGQANNQLTISTQIWIFPLYNWSQISVLSTPYIFKAGLSLCFCAQDALTICSVEMSFRGEPFTLIHFKAFAVTFTWEQKLNQYFKSLLHKYLNLYLTKDCVLNNSATYWTVLGLTYLLTYKLLEYVKWNPSLFVFWLHCKRHKHEHFAACT